MNPETHTLQRKMADITSLLSTVVELNQFAQRLVEKDLLSYQSMSSILQTLGYSKLHQAGQLMDAVMAQVRVTPKKFEAFVMILSYDTSLLHLKDDVMKTYRSLGGKLLCGQFQEAASTCTAGSEEPDLPTLLNEVAAAIPAKWRKVGGQLKLPAGVLDGLEQQYSRPLDCFEHVLTEWERRRSSPYTWETLIAVLQSKVVGENALATSLSATYNGGVSPRRPSEPACKGKSLQVPGQPPTPPHPDQKPTLAELQTITVNGEAVSIITEVADNWKNICVVFNFDPNGRRLKLIEQKYPNQSEDCCREMFQTWLKIPGSSWGSLIFTLEACGEATLAEQVKTYVGIGPGMVTADEGVEPMEEAAVPLRQGNGGGRGGGGGPNIVRTLSGEKAFKVCYPDLLRGISNDKAEDLIADLYAADLLTAEERDQLYEVQGGQKSRQVLSALEKRISAEPTCFYTLLEVLEADHSPLAGKMKDKISKQKT